MGAIAGDAGSSGWCVEPLSCQHHAWRQRSSIGGTLLCSRHCQDCCTSSTCTSISAGGLGHSEHNLSGGHVSVIKLQAGSSAEYAATGREHTSRQSQPHCLLRCHLIPSVLVMERVRRKVWVVTLVTRAGPKPVAAVQQQWCSGSGCLRRQMAAALTACRSPGACCRSTERSVSGTHPLQRYGTQRVGYTWRTAGMLHWHQLNTWHSQSGSYHQCGL